MNSTGNLNLSITSTLRVLGVKPVLVQVLVFILLCVNGLMIFTFLKKETFRDTRYILFAQTLFVDSTLMLMTDISLLGLSLQYFVHIIPCYFYCHFLSVFSLCSPVTLVAMCLERYVAICLPLRHASITTPKNTFTGLLIVWGVSSVIPSFTLILAFAYIPPGTINSYVLCTIEVMLRVNWLSDLRGAGLQILFVIMLCFIAFIYIRIMNAAKSVSAENKKSTNKGLKTVILHGIQLLLCMMQLIYPYIEMLLSNIEVTVFLNVRYSNYIVFCILPRCLSPLVYGLRDEKFRNALKLYAFCGVSFVFNKHKIRDGKTFRGVASISIQST